ncbi:MAG: protein kinase [Rhodothermales bacterium]
MRKPIDPAQWKRVDEILDLVLDADPDDRDALLRASCGEDLELFNEIRSLLERQDSAAAMFGKTAARVIGEVSDDDGSRIVSERLGAYEVVRRIGRGGMGSVFEAARADGSYEQRVAIKLLPTLFPSEADTVRFNKERQILARLEHPNIARLLDGGSTVDGKMFIVMELVDGVPIDTYCDDKHLSITERIRLFVQICKAVEFAHANLVVHRDLKPSNVLVSDSGTAKLLDFGIAKLLDESESADQTQTGQLRLTPGYAAPEQIVGRSITTATDVYSLGVILYELLAGTRPYDVASRSMREIERIVCDTQPARPSTMVASATDEAVFSARSTTRTGLQKRLTGDLDVIVATAMAKEPERRYRSAGELSSDLLRHLSNRPVHARGDTAGYRFRKFVQRHRGGVLVSILLAVTAGLGFAGIIRQSAVARAERDRAELVATYLEDLIAAPNPLAQSRIDTLTAWDLVAETRRAVETRFAGRADLQSRLLHMIGRTYIGAHQYGDAVQALERSLDLHQQSSLSTTKLALIQKDLAIARMERASSTAGRDSTVVPLLRSALSTLRKNAPDEKQHEILVMTELARALSPNDSLAHSEAKDLLVEAASMADDPKLNNSGIRSLVWSILAEKQMADWDMEAASASYKRALDEADRDLGPDNIHTLNARTDYAFTLNQTGRYEEALEQIDEALPLLSAIRASDDPRIRQVRRTRAVALRELGRFDDAETELRALLDLDIDAPDHAVTLGSLATLLWKKGDLAGAASVQREVIASSRARFGWTRSGVAFSYGKLADILMEARRYKEAETALQEAYTPIQTEFGESNSATEHLRSKLVELYLAWDKPEAARNYSVDNALK